MIVQSVRKRSFVKDRKAKEAGLLLGYARVSKGDDQTNALQTKALRAAGCRRLFEETASGGRWDRPELHRLLDQLREGDTVVVWKLDRLSRSLKDVLHIMERIAKAGAGFRSVPRQSRWESYCLIQECSRAGRALPHQNAPVAGSPCQSVGAENPLFCSIGEPAFPPRPGAVGATARSGEEERSGATRSHAQRALSREHGEAGEHRTFPEASTVAHSAPVGGSGRRRSTDKRYVTKPGS